MSIIIFLVVLAVLIFVHELGHFILARLFRVRVDAFKIGFGPRLLYWKSKETEYGVNAIPFGGYVKIFGENPDADSLVGHDSKRSFVNKPRYAQVLILGAGVFFNFLFAWLLYTIVFVMGVTVPQDTFEKYADRFEDKRIMLVYVLPDSPAAKAGLREGDAIRYVENLKMNAERVKIATADDPKKTEQTIEEIQNIIASGDEKPVSVEYERDGQRSTIGLVGTDGIVEGKKAVGISMDYVADLKLGIGSAVVEGFKYTMLLIKETCVGLYNFFANIFRGSPNFTDVAGPVGIAGIIGSAAERGMVYLLMITAIISINLGVINLVPFPALDGGRILFVLIEASIRRRISPKVANTINAIGFLLLMLLMVAVTWKDISKFFV